MIKFDIARAAGSAGPINQGRTGRQVITADITVNSHSIGEYAEALID
jgi:hypothetical protein